MKLIFTFLYIAFVLSYQLHSQKWDNTFGTNNNTETQRDVIESYDHGYLISGSYKIPSPSNWLIKTDINGNMLWNKVILHNQHEVFSGNLKQNSSGEIAIGRCITKENGDQWPTVVKLDSCGNKLWCREFVDNQYSHGWFEDVLLFDNGDILALGYLFSLANYNERIFLYYIDSNGNLVWRQSYASKENHPLVLERSGYQIQEFNNEYIITGRCYYPHPWNPGVGYRRPFFIGIDSTFEERWILPFGLNDTITGKAYDLIQLDSSTYMGVGYIWENGEDQNTLLMFFNSDGEELGCSQIYNDAIGPDVTDNITGDIARLNDTLFITTVLFGPGAGVNSNGEFIIDTAANIYKIEQRPNTLGRSVLIKTFDDKFTIGCNYKHPNSNYDIYLYKINDSLQHDTVYPGNYTYDSLCPYQIQSGEIDISDCLIITEVGETPTPEEYFARINTIPVKVYPNPSKGNEITFEYQNTEHNKNMELRCFDVYGQLMHFEKVYPHQGKSIIPLQDWIAGVYMGLVYAEGKIVGSVKFAIQ